MADEINDNERRPVNEPREGARYFLQIKWPAERNWRDATGWHGDTLYGNASTRDPMQAQRWLREVREQTPHRGVEYRVRVEYVEYAVLNW